MKIHRRKNKRIIKLILLLALVIGTLITIKSNKINNQENIIQSTENINKKENGKQDLGWELMLANTNNKIAENYKIELKYIDQNRQIDARIYEYYKNMMNDMKNDGITNVWPQSAYRSVEYQKEVFNNKVKYYKKQGMTTKEAEIEAEKLIMKPGCSDHNLGLAIDFNYVNEGFEHTEAFKWLQKNAEDYGFVLRYPKDKEKITKVKYEPWHWRYVGVNNAKKMNKKGMCLEEYIEYLK